MKIGVFGGSFNPPHKMHKELVVQLLNQNILDKVIVIPTGTSYPKLGLIPAYHRVSMLKLMFQDMNHVIVSDYEQKTELIYTYQTLDYIQKQYPNDIIYFICGSDNLKELFRWREYEYMLEHYHFIVVLRNQDQILELQNLYPQYQSHIHFLKLQLQDISSTFIRGKIKVSLFDEVRDILDERVYHYIKEKQFYRK